MLWQSTATSRYFPSDRWNNRTLSGSSLEESASDEASKP
jgi:hypothetical protein